MKIFKNEMKFLVDSSEIRKIDCFKDLEKI